MERTAMEFSDLPLWHTTTSWCPHYTCFCSIFKFPLVSNQKRAAEVWILGALRRLASWIGRLLWKSFCLLLNTATRRSTTSVCVTLDGRIVSWLCGRASICWAWISTLRFLSVSLDKLCDLFFPSCLNCWWCCYRICCED